MSRNLDALQRDDVIDHYEWFDQDGVPDFTIWFTDRTLFQLEVKNVRSGSGPLRVETQKTRASRSDPMSRYYRVDHFEDDVGVSVQCHWAMGLRVRVESGPGEAP